MCHYGWSTKHLLYRDLSLNVSALYYVKSLGKATATNKHLLSGQERRTIDVNSKGTE